jgi:ribulose-5-phosphate 4-epimerase/fuculose-1-phosphate aldolase
MVALERAIKDLVIANRILAHEGVMDASGHVSLRDPQDPGRFLLSCSRSPQVVAARDIMLLTLDGRPVDSDARPLYLERFIHGAIFEARPDIQAVVHAHAEDVLPFTISDVPLKPVIGSASSIGPEPPLWDIADKFGDETNMLVTSMAQARDLAAFMGSYPVVLMRGHGYAAASQSLIQLVRMCIFLSRNARVLLAATQLGGAVRPLSAGEVRVKGATYNPRSPEMWRGWEYWAIRAGCADLLDDFLG